MSRANSQERIASGMGVLFLISALILFVRSQTIISLIPVFYGVQLGNILLISTLMAAISALHAWMARLADDEKRDKRDSGLSSHQMFENELDIIGKNQHALRQFKKVVLPIFLVLISLLELGLAYRVARNVSDDPQFFAVGDFNSLLITASLLAAVAIVFYVCGKYCSGSAYKGRFIYLRPVTGYTLLCSFICALGAVVSLLLYWRFIFFANILTWFLCSLALFLAAERLILWIVDYYRPHSYDIEDLPIYESRMLSLFSQPKGVFDNFADMIDYQFGFKISGNWFYCFLNRTILPLVLLQLGSLILLSCIIHIRPYEEGLIQRLNSPTLKTLGPGIHIDLPWPFVRVFRLPVLRPQALVIPKSDETEEGVRRNESNLELWQDEKFSRNLFLSAGHDGPDQTKGHSGVQSVSVNLAHVSLSIHYRIIDGNTYFSEHKDVRELLSNLVLRELTHFLLVSDFMSVMRQDIGETQDRLRSKIDKIVGERNLGIEIVHLGVSNLQPPSQVASAFKEVIDAEEDRRRFKLEAEKYAIQTSASADHMSNRIVRRAESETALTTRVAEVEKSNYIKQYKIYSKYPRLYKIRATMEALEEWLRDTRKIISTMENARDVITIELLKDRPDLLTVPME